MNAEHISYAMRNEEATQALIWFNNPADLLHWTMPIVEVLVIGGALLALLHAWKNSKREGNPAYVHTWLATIIYGLIIEVIAYNYVDNFWHGEFTVMFYFNHLPLYIMALYPAVLYPTFMLVRAMNLHDKPYGRVLEACCAGFAAQMLYAPFDNMGPMLSWWIWDPEASTLQPFWNSVPSTSYLWITTLSMMFYLFARWLLWERASARRYSAAGWWLSALAVGLGTNIASVALQIPVSILAQRFAHYFMAGVIITLLMLANAWVYWFSPRDRMASLDKLLLVFPVLWCSFFIALYCHFIHVIFQANSQGVSQYGTPIGNYAIAVLGITMILLVYIMPSIESTRRPEFRSGPSIHRVDRQVE